MPALWALAASDWIFAIGGLVFCLMAPLLLKALPEPRSGFLAVLLSPLNVLTSAGIKAVNKIVSVFGPATLQPQAAVGSAMHNAARLVDDVADELISSSVVNVATAQALGGQLTAGDLAIERAKLQKQIRAATNYAKGIGADVQPRIDGAVQGIEAGVNTRVGSLDRELGRIEHREIPNLRARTRALEDGALDTFKWIRAHPLSVATGVFTGAVAIALGRLGMAWPKCENWKRIGKSVCGLPLGLIEDLFATSVIALAITDLCAYADAVESLAQAVTPALMALVDVEEALVGCHGATAPPDLAYTAPRLPARNLGLPLAA